MSLEDEIRELEKHIQKLEQSNIELEAFFKEEGLELYRSSIEENKILIHAKLQKVFVLKEKIEKSGMRLGSEEDDEA